MRRADFLLEIFTEELPPKMLKRLAVHLHDGIIQRLKTAGLSFKQTRYFATPRRLAVQVERLQDKQADSIQERKGPALKSAFDAAGQPTVACLGFARSCGVSPLELITLKEPQGEWVGFREQVPGKTVYELMPVIVDGALSALPIAKRMRWGAGATTFVRPVHSVILLYGRDIIPAEILGCETNRQTQGHRFYSKKPIAIYTPSRYEATLEKNHVIPDFAKRREAILDMAQAVAVELRGRAVIEEAVLDEVTGLVEWPVAVAGHFPEKFLHVPNEILVSAMQDHQRYFPVVNSSGNLLPHFVTISNIESRDVQQVVSGNERVLRARLSDADFFWQTDKKTPLAARSEKLKHIVFQKKLGTLYDKSQRITALAEYIAGKIGSDTGHARRAAALAKCDLVTEVVGEFPELQGVMGRYYAKHDGEPAAVASAIAEHYRPRFAGDTLPESATGCVLALADRVDTITGIFGAGDVPTGERDPFGLRRAAVGILRLLIEKEMDLDLADLFTRAKALYGDALQGDGLVQNTISFVLDRLKPWYQDQDFPADAVAAVLSLNLTRPYDIHRRIVAVHAFAQMSEANSLSTAIKRVSNILARATLPHPDFVINKDFFEHAAEAKLADALAGSRDRVLGFSQNGQYTEALHELAGLREPVDTFFAGVMVMAEDLDRRNNRLQLLRELQTLFLHVADMALLR